MKLGKGITVLILVTMIPSIIAAMNGEYELSVVFSFWASISLAIYSLTKEPDRKDNNTE